MVWCSHVFLLLIIYVKLKTVVWIELRTHVCHIFPCTVCTVEYILSVRVVRAVRAVPRTLCAPFPYFQKYSIPGSGLGGAAAGAEQEPHSAINRRQELSRGG